MAGSATAERPRRTQAERSAETRERLLDATLACLAEHGWAHTTTTLVAQEAGVSRGAQLHHFPTRSELVAAAVRHLGERRLAEFARAVRDLPAGSDLVASGIDLIWSMFRDPTAYALLELVVAARTDPELRGRLGPVTDELERRFEEFTSEIFPEDLHRSARLRTLRDVTFLLLQGLAVHSIVDGDPAKQAEVLDFLKDLSRRTLTSILEEDS